MSLNILFTVPARMTSGAEMVAWRWLLGDTNWVSGLRTFRQADLRVVAAHAGVHVHVVIHVGGPGLVGGPTTS